MLTPLKRFTASFLGLLALTALAAQEAGANSPPPAPRITYRRLPAQPSLEALEMLPPPVLNEAFRQDLQRVERVMLWMAREAQHRRGVEVPAEPSVQDGNPAVPVALPAPSVASSSQPAAQTSEQESEDALIHEAFRILNLGEASPSSDQVRQHLLGFVQAMAREQQPS